MQNIDPKRDTPMNEFLNRQDGSADFENREQQTFTHKKPDKGEEFAQMDEDIPVDESNIHIKHHGHSKLLPGEIKENTSLYGSAFNIFKANVGTGVFMIPTYYKDSGYIGSVISTLLIGVIVHDVFQLLITTKVKINRRDKTTYSGLCGYIGGAPLSWFLFVSLCLTQFGFCVVYSQVFSSTFEDLLEVPYSRVVWPTVMFAACFLMTCFSHNLAILSIGSILATIGVIYSLSSCIAQAIMVIHSNGGIHKSCTLFGRNIPVGWFNKITNDMFSMEGVAVILPVHAASIQKKHVPIMTTISVVAIVTIYALAGIVGYFAYGNEIHISMISMMKKDTWGISIRCLFIINILLTYPVQFMSAIQLIDQVSKSKPRGWRGLLIRFFINFLIWVCAVTFGADAVNIVVNFIGAIPAVWIILFIPTLLRSNVGYAIEHPEENRMTLRYWKMMLIGLPGKHFTWLRIRLILYFVLGILIMVLGSYSIVTIQILGH